MSNEIKNATDLETLRAALIAFEGDDWPTDLPTFGGTEPSDTAGVWSWDADRVLVGTCADDLMIEHRSDPDTVRRIVTWAAEVDARLWRQEEGGDGPVGDWDAVACESTTWPFDRDLFDEIAEAEGRDTVWDIYNAAFAQAVRGVK